MSEQALEQEQPETPSLLGEQSAYEWKGEVPEKFKGKAPEDVVSSYTELEQRFGGFSGAPEAYELVKPEGLEGEFDPEDNVLTGFQEVAKELNMSQDAFNKVVDYYLNSTVMSEDDMEAARQEEIKSLGQNGEAMIKDVDDFLRANLDSELYKEAAQGLTSAASVKAFHHLIKATAPKTPPIDDPANAGGLTKEKWEEMRFAKTESGERRMSVDPEYKKMVDDYGKRLHGED